MPFSVQRYALRAVLGIPPVMCNVLHPRGKMRVSAISLIIISVPTL